MKKASEVMKSSALNFDEAYGERIGHCAESGLYAPLGDLVERDGMLEVIDKGLNREGERLAYCA